MEELWANRLTFLFFSSGMNSLEQEIIINLLHLPFLFKVVSRMTFNNTTLIENEDKEGTNYY